MEETTVKTPVEPGDARHLMPTAEERREKYRRKVMDAARGKSLARQLLEKRDYFRGLDREVRRKHLRDVDRMIRYFGGDQYGFHDEHGDWHEYNLQAGDFAYTINVTEGHVEQAMMVLLKVEPEYEAAPYDANNPDESLLARMCQKVAADQELPRLMNEDNRQAEILNSLMAGRSFRCLHWSADPQAPHVVTRIKYREETVEVPARRECAACGAQAAAPAEPAAPGPVEPLDAFDMEALAPYADPAAPAEAPPATLCPCGSNEVRDIPASTRVEQVEDGEEEVVLGRNQMHIPHSMGVQDDFGATAFANSTFVVERDYLRRHIAEERYQIDLGEDGAEVGPSDEMQFRKMQERSFEQMDAVVGSARDEARIAWGPGRDVEREHHYMTPDECGEIYLHEEEELPDGTKIGPGFINEFQPTGTYFVTLEDKVVHVEEVSKARRWSAVLYGRRPGSARGKGAHSLPSLNDIVNDSFNLSYATSMTVGYPLTAVWRRAVRQLPEVGNILFIDQLPPNARGVDAAISRQPGSGVSMATVALSEQVEKAMQFIMGTFSATGGGAPDIKAMSTATGVNAVQEQSTGRMRGPIGQRIFADMELLYQILENIRDNASPEQRAELVNIYGPDVVEEFFNCNFRHRILWRVKKGTEAPRSAAVTQANLAAYSQAAASLKDAPWGNEVLALMADAMGFPPSVGSGRVDRREAEFRINKLTALYRETADKYPAELKDPALLASKLFKVLKRRCQPLASRPGEEGFEDFVLQLDHQVFLDVYKDWLFGEAARSAPVEVKSIVAQMWNDHVRAMAAFEMIKAGVERDVQALVAPPPQQPSPEEQLAAADQEQQRQLAGKAAEHELGQVAADNDLRRRIVEEEHRGRQAITVNQATQPPGAGAGA